MKNEINILQRFRDELCTFEVAKKAAAAGMTCANTFFAYDEHGEVTDGGWLQKVTGLTYYPAINFAMSVAMLENMTFPVSAIKLEQEGDSFFLTCNEITISANNIVDVIILTWIKYKR